MNHTTIVHYRPEDFEERLRHLIEDITESRCKNATSTIIQELKILLKVENVTTDVTDQQPKSEDALAVLYIVFVLFFFAASLLVLLLKYLRRERESSRLQKFYEDYLDAKNPRWVCYDKTGRRLQTQVSRESSGTVPDSPRPTSTNIPLTSPPTTPPPPTRATVLLEHEF